MYTTTEAKESHCNFRGTKQETSKLLQVAHLPSCLGFIPGVSTGVGYGTCGGREDREEERGTQRNSTQGAHLNKNRSMKMTSCCFLQGSCYHSDLVSSPATNSSHLLAVDDVCAGLDYYIFIHLFLHLLLYKCIFSTFVITKSTTFKQMCLKNSYSITVGPEMLLWIYCFVH